MSILAHLSDLHLLERDHHKRRGLPLRRLQYLSTGSPLDAEGRLQRVITTLQQARRAGADHVLITGDLTEDGVDAQFEMMAEALDRSGLAPETVTLVPGNHDGYADGTAFARALEGPLKAYARSSGANALTVLQDAVIAPISTMLPDQWFGRSRGIVRNEDVAHVRRLASDGISRDRAVVVAMHHPPSHHPLFPVEWFDGTGNALAMRDLLLERTRVHVLHGHIHKHTTKHLTGRQHAQVYSTASIRDEHATGLALRFYKAEDGNLHELLGVISNLQPTAAVRELPRALALSAS